MAAQKTPKQKTGLFDKMHNNVVKIASFVSALTALIGAGIGLCTWTSTQMTSAISAEIDRLRVETRTDSTKNEQAITRVELMILMNQDPYNTVAIEKIAKHYFKELNGDMYMTQLYSKWAREYNGDTTIVIGVD